MQECYETYLLREISLFKPQVLLALGNEVRNFLARQKGLGVPVVGIKHPSYFYRRDIEAETLSKIKAEIQLALRGVASASQRATTLGARRLEHCKADFLQAR